MIQPIYVICGGPATGKTYVCTRLTEVCHYIPHDLHFNDHETVVMDAAKNATKPVITEKPFGERKFMDTLRDAGFVAHAYFVTAPPLLVKERYEKREGKPCPQGHMTRAANIMNRVNEWNAPHGSSDEVLKMLKEKFK